MYLDNSGTISLFLLSSAVSTLLFFYAWSRRQKPAVKPFTAIAFIASIWSVISGLQILIASPDVKIIASALQYVATVSMPVAWLVFTVFFTGRTFWLTKGRFVGIILIPVITLVLVASHNYHELMFKSTWLSVLGPYLTVVYVYGPWFFIHTFYSYVLIGAGIVLLVFHRLYGPTLYRSQDAIMLVGVLLPLALNVVFLASPKQFNFVDLTPVGFSVAAVFLAWGLFKLNLLDLVPVARSAIVESITDAVIVLDDENRVIDLNAAAKHFFRTPKNQWIGTHISDLTSDVDGAWTDHQNKGIVSKEIALVVDGEKRFFDWRISQLQDRHNRMSTPLMVVVLRDITDRKRAEAIESGQKRILSMIVEGKSLSDALDALTRFVEQVISVEAVCSITKFQANGRTSRHEETQPEPPNAEQALNGTQNSSKAVSFANVAKNDRQTTFARDISDSSWKGSTSDVSEHHFHACWSKPIYSSSKTLLGTLSLYYLEPRVPRSEDIHVAEIATYLAGIAIERKQFEHELMHAKDEAEEMARLKSSFLANMSHEIRTPLSSIIGFADTLAQELETNHREFATLIGQSGKRLLNTLNSVLDYARLESGKMDVRFEIVNLTELVRETVSIFQAKAKAKGLVLEMHSADLETLAKLDRSLFIRALDNLTENAIKFTEKGVVSITMREEPNVVVIEIQDTGCGISEAFLPSVFDEFKQESSGMARSHEGSGLGLRITKQLVEQMNGTISVSSQKHVGSVFTLRFPRYERVKKNTRDKAFNLAD